MPLLRRPAPLWWKPMLDEAAIEALATRFQACTLPRAEWTHAAHFAVALWLLRHRPEQASAEGMGPMIRAYNESVGTANSDASGYHHTITVASLRLAADCLARHDPATPLAAVLAALLASPAGRSDWLAAYWSHECLFSVAARRGWVAPDLAPLPGG
jgi:uncharacterized protein YfaS (alpha-2-macroglobulin family)